VVNVHEVEMVDLERPERLAEQFVGLRRRVGPEFRDQKQAVAPLREDLAQGLFGVAVGSGRVDVRDAPVDVACLPPAVSSVVR
jgi:hypothetical protein